MLAQLKHPALMKVTLYKMGNLCGICAPVLWASIIIFCGSVRPEYSHFTQFISELGERGSSTEFIMRYAGFLPTGFMHVAFSAFLYVTFKGSRLAAVAATLLAINGLARIGAGIFPCEVGCTGSLISQKLHTLSSDVGFSALIGSAVLWGILFRRYQSLRGLSVYSISSGFFGFVFLVLMSRSAELRMGTGLYQRVSTGVLSLWVFMFAARLWWLKAYNVKGAGRLTFGSTRTRQ